MYQIQQITSQPKQKQNLVLPDGSSVEIQIYFAPIQYGWFITELISADFVLNGLRITNSPNMLHQFKNKIPFGIACFSISEREPTQQEDFSSGASKLYILSPEEVDYYAGLLQNG